LKNRQILKGTKMSKTKGLTSLAIEAKREEIAAAKAELASLVRMRKDARIQIRAEKAAAKELKAIDRAEKKAARIAKLEAKLLALKTGPVGIKALKANRKPSKVTVKKIA
jgi:capsule polysaccharide export protein KpsE/RkpR